MPWCQRCGCRDIPPPEKKTRKKTSRGNNVRIIKGPLPTVCRFLPLFLFLWINILLILLQLDSQRSKFAACDHQSISWLTVFCSQASIGKISWAYNFWHSNIYVRRLCYLCGSDWNWVPSLSSTCYSRCSPCRLASQRYRGTRRR
jgi:hypothetical protein